MSLYPKYTIEDCCTGASASINIDPTSVQHADGIYKWSAPNTSFQFGPNGQVTFQLIQNRCYIITYRDAFENVTYPNIPFSSLTIELPGTQLNCSQATNCDCNPGNIYIKADPCCTADPPLFFKGESFPNYPSTPQFDITQYPAVWRFDGDQNNLVGQGLTPGACYTFTILSVTDPASEITLAQWLTLPYPPFTTMMTYFHKDFCPPAGSNGDVQCQSCETCYVLTGCDGLIIKTTLDFSNYVGTYVTLSEYPGNNFLVEINQGLCVNPDTTINMSLIGAGEDCPCLCYEVIGRVASINYINCEGKGQVIYPPAKFCAQSPPIITEIPGADYTLIVGTDCINDECPIECFELINCDHEAYPSQPAIISSTLQSLTQYANTNQVVVLNEYEGCWTVSEASCQCITVTINGTVYNAYATTMYDGSKVFTFDYETVPYYIWAGTYPGSWHITQTIGVTTVATELGYIGSGILNCPIATDSVWIKGQGPAGDPITTLATSLCDDQCHCAVNVTVLRDHDSCQSCILDEVGFEAYKLTNCENPSEITYSLQDLSIYVDNIVKDECKCWLVERIYTQPPSSVTITNLVLYSSCESCLATYYQLDNCQSDGSPLQIITASNLSAYVDKVIKIEGCDDCFTVTLYDNVAEPANSQNVVVSSDFEDCVTCNTLLPRCSTVFNTNVTDEIYSFVNANGDIEQTALVKSGQSSLRYCVQRWIEQDLQTGIFNFYGDCTVFETDRVKTGFCVQYFPNDRKVKPGYNTPICSAEKYDKITCNFADIAYKKALELRYGISDCCPEANEKWLVKKELIELQALTDPNYTCDPSTDCCDSSSSDSSCNS